MMLALSACLACTRTRSSKGAAYFPETGEVEGWTKSSATRMFPAERLFEYIDGDADRYLKAGVEQTLTCDYRYRDKLDAVADIFVMRNATGAQQVFEAQPPNGSQPLQVGDSARLYPGTLMLRKGRFFVRLVAYEVEPETPEALLSLARSIAYRIK